MSRAYQPPRKPKTQAVKVKKAAAISLGWGCLLFLWVMIVFMGVCLLILMLLYH